MKHQCPSTDIYEIIGYPKHNLWEVSEIQYDSEVEPRFISGIKHCPFCGEPLKFKEEL